LGADSFQWCPATGQGQRAQTEAEEFPPEHEEVILYFEGDGALEQLPRGVVESPSLETFKSCLDMFLCNLL